MRRHVEAGRGRRAAILGDGFRLSYGELDGEVLRRAALFREAGLGPGERVALLGPDGPDLLASFLSVLAAGGVAVPLNTAFSREELAFVLEDCRPRLLLVDPSLPALAPESPGGTERWSFGELAERAAGTRPAGAYAPTHRDGFAFLLYSSGTTGRPKGVLHLHHDAWVCCRSYGRRVLEIGPGDRTLSVARLFFAYGLGNSLYFPLSVGGSAVLFPDHPAPEVVFDQVERHRPTLLFGVPTAFARMLSAMEEGAGPDLSSVRLCLSAGEALPAPLFERWRGRTGLEILDGIGTTELCHIFLSNRRGAVVPGSAGTPVEGYRVRLVDGDGAPVPPGEPGDLEVRGDSIMALYWNRHEETKRRLRGPWITTGDKVVLDPERGVYRHAGRSDDMLKVAGIWVSPVEVEGRLLEHPAVAECAVVGERDAEGLEVPRAFVVLHPGTSGAGTGRRGPSEDGGSTAAAGEAKPPEAQPPEERLSEELRAFVREALAPYKCPRRITFVEELPRTATGKVRRFRLREAAGP